MKELSRKCCSCLEIKDLCDFHKSNSSNGHSYKCKKCAIEISRKWYFENKEKKQKYDKKRREQQRWKYREASKRNRQKNKIEKNACTASRRRHLRARMPKWTSPKKIKCFYEMAMRVSKCLMIKHHVDHIVPIKGKTVSGLHAPVNLRVIPASQNMKKLNKFLEI